MSFPSPAGDIPSPGRLRPALPSPGLVPCTGLTLGPSPCSSPARLLPTGRALIPWRREPAGQPPPQAEWSRPRPGSHNPLTVHSRSPGCRLRLQRMASGQALPVGTGVKAAGTGLSALSPARFRCGAAFPAGLFRCALASHRFTGKTSQRDLPAPPAKAAGSGPGGAGKRVSFRRRPRVRARRSPATVCTDDPPCARVRVHRGSPRQRATSQRRAGRSAAACADKARFQAHSHCTRFLS